MVQSAAKSLTFSRSSTVPVASTIVVASFAWLLTNDLVHPFAVYCLQLFLSF